MRLNHRAISFGLLFAFYGCGNENKKENPTTKGVSKVPHNERNDESEIHAGTPKSLLDNKRAAAGQQSRLSTDEDEDSGFSSTSQSNDRSEDEVSAFEGAPGVDTGGNQAPTLVIQEHRTSDTTAPEATTPTTSFTQAQLDQAGAAFIDRLSGWLSTTYGHSRFGHYSTTVIQNSETTSESPEIHGESSLVKMVSTDKVSVRNCIRPQGSVVGVCMFIDFLLKDRASDEVPESFSTRPTSYEEIGTEESRLEIPSSCSNLTIDTVSTCLEGISQSVSSTLSQDQAIAAIDVRLLSLSSSSGSSQYLPTPFMYVKSRFNLMTVENIKDGLKNWYMSHFRISPEVPSESPIRPETIQIDSSEGFTDNQALVTDYASRSSTGFTVVSIASRALLKGCVGDTPLEKVCAIIQLFYIGNSESSIPEHFRNPRDALQSIPFTRLDVRQIRDTPDRLERIVSSCQSSGSTGGQCLASILDGFIKTLEGVVGSRTLVGINVAKLTFADTIQTESFYAHLTEMPPDPRKRPSSILGMSVESWARSRDSLASLKIRELQSISGFISSNGASRPFSSFETPATSFVVKRYEHHLELSGCLSFGPTSVDPSPNRNVVCLEMQVIRTPDGDTFNMMSVIRSSGPSRLETTYLLDQNDIGSLATIEIPSGASESVRERFASFLVLSILEWYIGGVARISGYNIGKVVYGVASLESSAGETTVSWASTDDRYEVSGICIEVSIINRVVEIPSHEAVDAYSLDINMREKLFDSFSQRAAGTLSEENVFNTKTISRRGGDKNRRPTRIVNRIGNPLVSMTAGDDANKKFVFNCFVVGSGTRTRICLDFMLRFTNDIGITNQLSESQFVDSDGYSTQLGPMELLLHEVTEDSFEINPMPITCETGGSLLQLCISEVIGMIMQQSAANGLTPISIDAFHVEYGPAEEMENGQYRFAEGDRTRVFDWKYTGLYREFTDVTDEAFKDGVKYMIEAHSEDPQTFASTATDPVVLQTQYEANAGGFYEQLGEETRPTFKDFAAVSAALAPIDETHNMKLVIGQSRGYFIACFKSTKYDVRFVRKVCMVFQLFFGEISSPTCGNIGTIQDAITNSVIVDDQRTIMCDRGNDIQSVTTYLAPYNLDSVVNKWQDGKISTVDFVLNVHNRILENIEPVLPLIAVNIASIKVGLAAGTANPNNFADTHFEKMFSITPFYAHLTIPGTGYAPIAADEARRTAWAQVYRAELIEKIGEWMKSKFPADYVDQVNILDEDSPGYYSSYGMHLDFLGSVGRSNITGLAMIKFPRRGFIVGCFDTMYGLRICVSMQVIHRLSSEVNAALDLSRIMDLQQVVAAGEYADRTQLGDSNVSGDKALFNTLNHWKNASPDRFIELIDEYIKQRENHVVLGLNLVGIRFGPYITGNANSASGVAYIAPSQFQREKFFDIPGVYLRTQWNDYVPPERPTRVFGMALESWTRSEFESAGPFTILQVSLPSLFYNVDGTTRPFATFDSPVPEFSVTVYERHVDMTGCLSFGQVDQNDIICFEMQYTISNSGTVDDNRSLAETIRDDARSSQARTIRIPDQLPNLQTIASDSVQLERFASQLFLLILSSQSRENHTYRYMLRFPWLHIGKISIGKKSSADHGGWEGARNELDAISLQVSLRRGGESFYEDYRVEVQRDRRFKDVFAQKLYQLSVSGISQPNSVNVKHGLIEAREERVPSRLINRIGSALVSRVVDPPNHPTKKSVYNCFTGGLGTAEQPKMRVCLDIVLHYRQNLASNLDGLNEESKAVTNVGIIPMLLDMDQTQNLFHPLPDSCGETLVADTIPVCVSDIIAQQPPTDGSLVAIEVIDIEFGKAQRIGDTDDCEDRFIESSPTRHFKSKYFYLYQEFEDVRGDLFRSDIERFLEVHSEDPRIYAKFAESGEPTELPQFVSSENSGGFYDKWPGDSEASGRTFVQVVESVAPIDETQNFKLVFDESRGYFVGCFRGGIDGFLQRKICILFQLFSKDLTPEIREQMSTVALAVTNTLFDNQNRRTYGSGLSGEELYTLPIQTTIENGLSMWGPGYSEANQVILRFLLAIAGCFTHPLLAINVAEIQLGLVRHDDINSRQESGKMSTVFQSDEGFVRIQPIFTHLISTFSNLSDEERTQWGVRYGDNLKEKIRVWMRGKFPSDFSAQIVDQATPGYVTTLGEHLSMELAIRRSGINDFMMRAFTRRGFIAGCIDSNHGLRICTSIQVLHRLSSELGSVDFSVIANVSEAITSDEYPTTDAKTFDLSYDPSKFLSKWSNASPERFIDLLTDYLKLRADEGLVIIGVNLVGIKFGLAEVGARFSTLSSSDFTGLFRRGKMVTIPSFYLHTQRPRED